MGIYCWTLGILWIVGLAWAQTGRGGDELYILIDQVSLLRCDGEPNKVQIRKEDVQITDENGNKINYIRAPGKIQIRFNRVSLDEPLPHISGELSALLEVPLIKSSFVRFDFPYSVIPEKKLTADVCDRESGVLTIRHNNGQQRNYCRYCDLCSTSARTEQALQRNNNLPELEKSRKELSFRRICHRLDAKTYSIARTVQLPGRRELERQANQQFQGLDGEIKRRFNKGEGKFRVRIHLLGSDNPPKDYAQTQRQRCAGRGLFGQLTCNAGCNIPFLGEDCRSYYAQHCIEGERMAACYTAVFYYKGMIHLLPQILKHHLSKFSCQRRILVQRTKTGFYLLFRHENLDR